MLKCSPLDLNFDTVVRLPLADGVRQSVTAMRMNERFDCQRNAGGSVSVSDDDANE